MAEVHRVQVAPQRLPRWLEGFAKRHGPPAVSLTADHLLLSAGDGAEATITLIWGALPGVDPLAELLDQLTRRRRLGALLVRKSSHAVGVFDGAELVVHSVGHHYVQGRTKAGGWSQQRYARRRQNQADRAYAKAGQAALSMLVPEVDRLHGLILGGDGRAVAEVLADPRLAALAGLVDRLPHRTLAVPDPNLKVLRESLPRFVAVPITLNDAARGRLPLAQDDDQPSQNRQRGGTADGDPGA